MDPYFRLDAATRLELGFARALPFAHRPRRLAKFVDDVPRDELWPHTQDVLLLECAKEGRLETHFATRERFVGGPPDANDWPNLPEWPLAAPEPRCRFYRLELGGGDKNALRVRSGDMGSLPELSADAASGALASCADRNQAALAAALAPHLAAEHVSGPMATLAATSLRVPLFAQFRTSLAAPGLFESHEAATGAARPLVGAEASVRQEALLLADYTLDRSVSVHMVSRPDERAAALLANLLTDAWHALQPSTRSLQRTGYFGWRKQGAVSAPGHAQNVSVLADWQRTKRLPHSSFFCLSQLLERHSHGATWPVGNSIFGGPDTSEYDFSAYLPDAAPAAAGVGRAGVVPALLLLGVALLGVAVALRRTRRLPGQRRPERHARTLV